MSAQPQPLFLTLHPDCNGTGYVADPEEDDPGWRTPCECNPYGERHYDPWLTEIPY